MHTTRPPRTVHRHLVRGGASHAGRQLAAPDEGEVTRRRGVERLREVVLDFEGVRLVGQGSADEVFRVWSSAHPEGRLIPVGMSEPVSFMVERARRSASSRSTAARP